MTRLLGIEIDRFASRLLIRLGVLGLLLLTSLTLFGAYQTARPPSAAHLAEAQRWYDDAAAEWERSGADQLASCKADEQRERASVAANGGDPDAISFGCEEMKPTLESYFGSVGTSKNCFTPYAASTITGCTSYPLLSVGAPRTVQIELRSVF